MTQKLKIGDLVQVVALESAFFAKIGCITSFLWGTTLPIHVTLNGDNHETDFKASELVLYIDTDDDSGCDDITNCRPNELRGN